MEKDFIRSKKRLLKLSIILIFTIIFFYSLIFNNNPIKKITLGIYQNEPKVFIDSKGRSSGIWVDLLNEIAKKEGWKINYFVSDWSGCLHAAAEGKIDLMVDVAYSKERAIIYDFNKIAVLESFSKIYSNKSLRIRKLSDLNGKKIAVLDSSIQEKNLILLKQNLFYNYELVKASSFQDAFLMTRNGTTDCAISNNFFGDYFYKEFNLKDTAIELFPSELFFVTKKGTNQDILTTIDKYLSEWKLDKNSVYYKILRKWKVSQKTRINNFFISLIIILGLIILFTIIYILFINKKLKYIRSRLKLTFDTLSLSEKYFKEYSEISPYGIFKTDNNGNILFINNYWQKISGYDSNECLGNGFFKFAFQYKWETIKNDWLNKVVNEKEFEKLITITDINNQIHFLKVRLKGVFSDKGYLEGYLGVFDDITKEMLMTEELNKKNKDLNILFDLSSIININLLNPDFTRTILNKIIEYFGISAAILFISDEEKIIVEDIQPENIRKLWHINDIHLIGHCLCGKVYLDGISIFIKDLRDEKLAERDECKNSGFKSIAVLPLKYLDKVIGILLLASFEEKDLSIFKNLLESICQQISVALNNRVLHLKLISYSKELENKVYQRTKELEEALEKAQFADRMKSAFLATMSHELRTPLNSIIGFTGVLLQELPGKLNEEQKKQLMMVKKSSQHLLDLINDVLDISKIEAGELKLYYEKFELLPLMEEIINSLIGLIQNKGLEFEFLFDNNINIINSDRKRLKQVIINLISNAIKFTDKGKISLICKKNGTFIEFEVIDTGIGIKKEDMNLLFKPFSQINKRLNRNYEGTGLGLSICKKIVELLGGEISFESKFGIGSKVRFNIPE
ncbi:MAG TPA: ATP-binding protein [Exilispira sp.]|nr:ATP-binding protein [Exilispira sp.]